MLSQRTSRPKEWSDEPSVVKRRVKVEQCNCERMIDAITLITYLGQDNGANKSVSACSKHSFERGAKQKVSL